MKVWTTADVRSVADAVGVEISNLREDGRALRFTLKPTGEKFRGMYKYQRTSASGFHEGRRVHAVCWHGYRDFMREVFRRDPDSRILTAKADYRNAADFEAKYGNTGWQNVGSMMFPMFYKDACVCDRNYFGVSTNEDSYAITMPQSMPAACPFVIFVPTHYRADGTCKCDDPTERERMIREWDYTEADFEGVPLKV